MEQNTPQSTPSPRQVIPLSLLGKDGLPPSNEGIEQADSAASTGGQLPDLAERHALRSARSLAELRDFVFFTPALLYLYVPLRGREPFHDFLAEYGRDVRPLTVVFSRPIFRGLEAGQSAYWNHALMAIAAEHWQAYTAWMYGVSFWFPEKKWFAKVRPMFVTIADPLYLERSAVVSEPVPRVEVGVFALDTNRGSLYLDDSGDPLTEPPRPIWSHTIPREIAILADALSREENKPFQAVEKALLPPELSTLTPSAASLLLRTGGKSMPPPPPTKRYEELSSEEREIVRSVLQKLK